MRAKYILAPTAGAKHKRGGVLQIMEIVTTTQTHDNMLDAAKHSARTKYETALHLAATAKDAARDAVLIMAEVGAMLEVGWEATRRGQVGADAGGEVRDNAGDNRPATRGSMAESWGIPRDDAEKALWLNRNREQLELELWPQDVAKVSARFCGLLPAPFSEGKEQRDTERPVTGHWLTYAGKLQRNLSSLISDRPLAKWRDDERESMRVALQPIVDLWKQL
jgi:hypothetical protein